MNVGVGIIVICGRVVCIGIATCHVSPGVFWLCTKHVFVMCRVVVFN